MRFASNLMGRLQDFLALAKSLDSAYLHTVIRRNKLSITAGAVLTIIIECIMIARLFISHPAIATPASRVYLSFYLSLIAISALYLLLQPRLNTNPKASYCLQLGSVTCYLLWNVLLNSYDLYRNQTGSSLALVTAIIFASILTQFRPHHMMLLQSAAYLLFFTINQGRIEDTINSSIAVTVAVVTNILFFVREIRAVHTQQQMTLMHAKMEKEQMEGSKQYLRRLQDAQTQTAIYHHDLRHTLNLLEQLARQGDWDKLLSFLSAGQEKLEQFVPAFYCEHEAVNLILGSFDQRAKERQVRLKTAVRLPEQLAVADTELCALLYNLLENALHGVEQVADSQQRHIYIKANINSGKLVILVENQFAGTIRMKDNRPIPLVPDKNHGFGIQSIIDITQHHQGLYHFEQEGQLFRSKILLYLEDANLIL